MTAAKGRQRRGRADHGTGGHENEVCVEETTLRATIIVHSLQVGHSNFCSVHALPPHKDMYLSRWQKETKSTIFFTSDWWIGACDYTKEFLTTEALCDHSLSCLVGVATWISSLFTNFWSHIPYKKLVVTFNPRGPYLGLVPIEMPLSPAISSE
jgi:hypothetical protein